MHQTPKCTRCNKPMQIARYKCSSCDSVLEGSFDLPPLARLDMEEQAFVTAFVRVHGNIKKMEELFGVSYPTIKNRLNALAQKLDSSLRVGDERTEILERLGRGEITVDEALRLLQ